MSRPADPGFFTLPTFRFLLDLEKNNSRQWFVDNKARYEEHVRQPALRLIAAMAAPLAKISPQILAQAKPVGGSLFRIHRDTRFSGDKTPYKTHLGISFHHASTKPMARSEGSNAAMGRLDAPILYLHVQPKKSFIAAGIWHPQPDSTKLIRSYLTNNPESWKKATRAPHLPAHWQLGGDSLMRPPRGYDPRHDLLDDLKRKDFLVQCELEDPELMQPDLVRVLARRYREVAPLYDWLCGALDLEF